MMAPKLIAGAFARERAVDTALTGLGLSAALVSVSFAGYMIVAGPPGAELHGGEPVPSETAPFHPPALASGLPDAIAASEGIDFTPTGSIAPDHQPAPVVQAQPGLDTALNDFAVRDVFDGTALVEAHGALHMVSPGDTLEGAGEVLAIERKGRGWLVRTADGTIRQRR